MGISCAFFTTAGPYIWNNFGCELVFFVLLLFIITILLFSLTTFTQPGIIPRRKILECFPENSKYKVYLNK